MCTRRGLSGTGRLDWGPKIETGPDTNLSIIIYGVDCVNVSKSAIGFGRASSRFHVLVSSAIAERKRQSRARMWRLSRSAQCPIWPTGWLTLTHIHTHHELASLRPGVCERMGIFV